MALLTGESRFAGQITGVGTTSGVRAVVGRWRTSPLGAFADVMVENAAGHRVLLAPDERVAEFVAATYTFDEVRIEPVRVTGDQVLAVRTPSLRLEVGVGRRTALGAALRLVPARVATAPAWTGLTDPVARVLVPGVRTRGSARRRAARVLRRHGRARGGVGDGFPGRRGPRGPGPRRPALPVRLQLRAPAPGRHRGGDHGPGAQAEPTSG